MDLSTPLGAMALAFEPLVLMSPWKPVLLLVTLCAWAWVVSTVYDKHAARFFLPREMWNAIHLFSALLALAVAVLMPLKGELSFWVGWVAMVVILIGDLVAYAVVANRDERVPADFRIKLDIVSKLAESRQKKKAQAGKFEAKLAIKGPGGKIEVPLADAPEAQVRAAAEALYIKAVSSRASQVDIVPIKDQQYAPSVLVDGVRTQFDAMPATNAMQISDFWRAAAGLDPKDRRRKLTGSVVVEVGGMKKDVRVSSVGVAGGMRTTLLFDPTGAVSRKPDTLGLLEGQMELLRSIVADTSRGVVLLVGQPDAGRTTTMYAVTAMHDAYTNNVMIVEIEPQLTLEGVKQTTFDPTAEGADFPTTVRSLLRRDPDVLSVAEMPDANTAKEVAKSDVERTRTYVALKADSALAGVEMYARAVGDGPLAAKGLRGVVFNKLVRKLCENCKVPYPPSPEMLKKLGAEPGKVQQLYKKGGQVLIKNKPDTCPVCQGAGYIGQTGIFEVFSIGAEERELIAQNNLAGLKAAFRKQNQPSLQQAAIRKALLGVTSVEEVQRVTAPPATAAPGASPGASPGAAPAPTGPAKG
jgi:type II secretory ATPase GspE/PulE/Tfp pilus assembly ATPase PilB-like protein